MAIRFSDHCRYDDRIVYLECKEVDGELKGLNFDVHIQDAEHFDLKLCRIEKGSWINVTQQIPDWVHEITGHIVDVLENYITGWEKKNGPIPKKG